MPGADEFDSKVLAKEVRILQKKLARSEADRASLEETNHKKEALLKRVICELQELTQGLQQKSSALEQAIEDLTRTQDKLIEAEKMAALGGLVAGVAHEINTPVGTSITLASTLADETKRLFDCLASGNLKRSLLNQYVTIVEESADLLLINLNRAGELIHSFKQIAVDQSTLECRWFNLKAYLNEVIISLSPHFKSNANQVIIEGDSELQIKSYPGAFAQIVTNLVLNSIAHGYRPDDCGPDESARFEIKITQQANQCILEYRDYGRGIESAHLSRIFEPFFTTARAHGGTGLGLHIVYNLVTQTLKGAIAVDSQVGQGVHFIITLPLSLEGVAT